MDTRALFCHHFGENQRPGAQFCRACGQALAVSGAALASEKAGPSVKTRARTSAQSTLATTVSTAAKSAGMSAVKDLCPSCGQPVRTGAAYCKNCGQKLS